MLSNGPAVQSGAVRPVAKKRGRVRPSERNGSQGDPRLWWPSTQHSVVLFGVDHRDIGTIRRRVELTLSGSPIFGSGLARTGAIDCQGYSSTRASRGAIPADALQSSSACSGAFLPTGERAAGTASSLTPRPISACSGPAKYSTFAARSRDGKHGRGVLQGCAVPGTGSVPRRGPTSAPPRDGGRAAARYRTTTLGTPSCRIQRTRYPELRVLGSTSPLRTSPRSRAWIAHLRPRLRPGCRRSRTNPNPPPHTPQRVV